MFCCSANFTSVKFHVFPTNLIEKTASHYEVLDNNVQSEYCEFHFMPLYSKRIDKDVKRVYIVHMYRRSMFGSMRWFLLHHAIHSAKVTQKNFV